MIASLWVDRETAVIVKRTEAGMEVRQIGGGTKPDLENPGVEDRQKERKVSDTEETGQITYGIGKQLRNYYDAIIAAVRNAESVLIFGPGSAKTELKHRFRELNVDVTHIVC